MPSGFSVHAYVCPSGALTTLGRRTLTGPAIRSTWERHSAARSSETYTWSSMHSNRAWQSPVVRVTTGTFSDPYRGAEGRGRRGRQHPDADRTRHEDLVAPDQVVQVRQPAADEVDGLPSPPGPAGRRRPPP